MATKKAPTKIVTAPDPTAASNRNKALFAVLLWYATSNDVVTINQDASATTSTINQKNKTLTDFANKFGVLTDSATFKQKVAWLEQQISQQSSLETYRVLNAVTGETLDAKINVGVAFKVVQETFSTLSRNTAFVGPPPTGYDPNDNCNVMDIIDIVPQPTAITSLKSKAMPAKKAASKVATKHAKKVATKVAKKAAKKNAKKAPAKAPKKAAKKSAKKKR